MRDKARRTRDFRQTKETTMKTAIKALKALDNGGYLVVALAVPIALSRVRWRHHVPLPPSCQHKINGR